MTWETSVNQLVLVFRDALRALAPHLEKVRIEWRDGFAYDDWDQIAQTIYEKIIVASVLWAMPEDERGSCQFPEYDMEYSSYAGKAVIVVNNTSAGERLIFHSFATEKEPFDRVRVCRVAPDGRVLEGGLLLVDADTAAYAVETPRMMLTEITVHL